MSIIARLKNLLKPGKSLSQKVVRSTFWVGAFKVTERTLRFIRTIIVARLLSPTDFGLFGLACLAMDILDRFSETGVKTALIQKKERSEDFLDTAWMINLIRNIFLFSLLFFGAPFIARFFNNLSAAPLIRVIAVIMIVRGLTNIGTVYFVKELDFRKQFVFQIAGTLVNIIITLILAFILRNAWALVWGYLAQSITNCAVSYILHPYRPKLRLELPKAKELLNFGKWIFGSSILIFLITQGDDILVGKVLGLTALGLYQMAYAISQLPTTEITHVVSQIAFPTYSKIQSDIHKLKEAYFRILQVTLFVSLPLAAGIFFFGYDFTRIALGDKWLPMVPTLMLLSIQGAIRAFGATTGPLFQAVGKPKIATKLQFAQFIMMATVIYPLVKFFGIFGAALTIVSVSIVLFFFVCYEVIRILKCSIYEFIRIFFVPTTAVFIMLSVLFLVRNIVNVSLLRNIISIAILGICLYIFVYKIMDKKCGYNLILFLKDKLISGVLG